MQKNIVHITGTDSYGVELEIQRWTTTFFGKYGNINIDRYDLGDANSLKGIGDIILMSGLFAEKRLFIFRGGRDRKSKAQGLELMLSEKFGNIPDDHFLLFHNIGEKEEGLISWLGENADIRRINTLWDIKAWEGRSDIDTSLLNLILKTYREAELKREKFDTNLLLGHDIAHTIEMTSLMIKNGQKIDISDIIGLCHNFGGDNMFALVDAIMSIDISLAIEIFRKISTTKKLDEWFGGFLGNLRNGLYIKYLKHLGSSEGDIANIVKIHPYVLKKGYSSKISYLLLKKLYKNLIHISIAYKRGKGLKDSELGRFLEIELAILDLQK